ncbi:MAG TPA: phage holin family protein [Cyclobacteriaceae bacterium]|nr:phage holin family protein [Cyclobacteriaceae bacterium]HRW99486.1 phage holin family protein [Cyclobacteriaceae bacterium]
MDSVKDTILRFLKLDSLVDNLSGYVETRVKLLKLEIKEDIAKVLSKGLVHLAIIVFAFLFLIFISIGFAHYLNAVLESDFQGFFIVAGIYFVLFILFLLFRKSFDKRFEQYFSDLINQKED